MCKVCNYHYTSSANRKTKLGALGIIQVIDDGVFVCTCCLKIERTLVSFLCLVSVITFRLIKLIFFYLMITNYNFILPLGPQIIIITLKNSLVILISVDISLEVLITPQGFSYLLLVVWIIRFLLVDPNLCEFRVLVLFTNCGITR